MSIKKASGSPDGRSFADTIADTALSSTSGRKNIINSDEPSERRAKAHLDPDPEDNDFDYDSNWRGDGDRKPLDQIYR